jgi:hypothetical protein
MEEMGLQQCPICSAEITEAITICPSCGFHVPQHFPSKPHDRSQEWMNCEPASSSNNNIILGITLIVIVMVVIALLAVEIIIPMVNNNQEGGTDEPFVVRTDPVDGAMDVEPKFSLKIFFSEPMTNHTTLHYDFWEITTNETETKWIDDKTAEITNLMFKAFESITIRFRRDPNLVDSDGNLLVQDYNWTFTTRPVKIDVISTTIFRYTEDDTLIYIYGELKNNEDYNLSLFDLVISGYDADGNYVGTSYYYSHSSPHTVKPGEIVPFMSNYRDTKKVVEKVVVESIKHVVIEMAYRYEGLEIIKADGSFEIIENYTCYIVNGTIINNGSRLAERIMVAATFYDSSGQVIAALEDIMDPSELNVTQTLDFEIGVYETECDVFSIDNYKLIVHELFSR